MALLAVRISVMFHPSLDVVGGARNSGFLDAQPGYLVAVKVKDLTISGESCGQSLVHSIEARRLSVLGKSEDEHRFELNITHPSHH